MCGITGIISKNKDIIIPLYESLANIQHRGQESSGIVTYSFLNDKLQISKNLDLVNSHLNKLQNLSGYIGLGHVRYPTTGDKSIKEIQPFINKINYEISLAHNGNIVNKKLLEELLIEKNIKIESTSDSEIILALFADELNKYSVENIRQGIIKSVEKIMDICIGSYSIIIMIDKFGLIAFRDKHGIRPLVYNKSEDFIQIASETVGLEGNTYQNINGGELIMIDKNLNVEKIKVKEELKRPCLFEYIYFATAESYIDNVLVYNFREKVGEKIIEEIPKDILEVIDIVVPIPLTSIISATAIANKINKPLKHAIIKNRYTHRTFINADTEIMKGIKKIKIIEEIVKDKKILLIDDSIVRGNTSKYIINKLKEAKVKEIYLISCSPPIRYPNIYGISLPTYKELIAFEKSEKEIAKEINVDKLYYLSLEKMLEVLRELNKDLIYFEDSVFTGKYIC